MIITFANPATLTHAELEEGSLVEVLQEWSPSVPPNYLYYPNRRQMSAAMRAFVDSMRV